MSSFLSKIKVKSALQAKRNKFDLSCSHVTTSDFYQNVPVYIHEMIPKETIKVNVSSMTRCSPLVNPLFGNIKTYYRAFFVPFRVIYPAWNDFIENTAHVFSNGTRDIPSYVPRIQLYNLYNFFINNSDVSSVVSGTSLPNEAYDFCIYASGGTGDGYTYYALTAKGKLIYKILTSLGYKFNWSTYGRSNADTSDYVSAMPLLAFAKIWCDWFSNPQYTVAFDLDTYFSDTDNRTLTVSDLGVIFNKVILMTYDLDYFTAAWDNPTSPNTGLVASGLSFADVSLMGANGDSSQAAYRNSVSLENRIQNPTGAPIQTPVIRTAQSSSSVPTGSSGEISQYILNVLHSVTDFVTRYRMVGSRALDRYMAEYGIQLSSEKLKRSVYLGKSEMDFKIGDVTQTSPDVVAGDSTQFGVGSYSGKMIGSCDGNFEYTTDEYGFFIITSFIVPRNNYVYGRPRNLFHLTPFDFFKGDFDALGCQGIRQDELVCFNGNVPASSTNYKSSGIFGFTPRYAEYKTALDNLSGDFILGTKNTLLDGWYLARKFSPHDRNAHTASFCYADGTQYNDIWQDGNSNFDHFFCVHYFNVSVHAPMKSLFDMYDYSNEDGNTITANLNGTNVLS